ncbi:hypothetical protein [Paraburkholderia phosphatilytica]|uniref:hypothetical protein n=1 Tax=Paraburkholderia phosphatilytica TaxID=2282883 RepID=UPI000E514B10|nr:hypothetical protein [Paraburkholderia phosphatilytica]
MQAQKRFAQLVLPMAVALPAFAAQSAMAADVSGAASIAPVANPPATAAVVPAATEAGAPAVTAAAVAPASPAAGTTGQDAKAAQDSKDTTFGVAMSSDQLDEHRGGDALIGTNNLTGSVEGNLASHVATGSNVVDGGSFANSSGLPTVIQNTGANVLIQNATVLNVRFGD